MTASAIQTFSPKQLEERRKTLGASEIPVVAGYVPFKSPLQLWAEKRGLLPSFDGNEFTEWGNRLEAVIADKYAEVVGMPIATCETIISTEESWRSCTPDRIVGARVRGLEVKCRGIHRADEWGESGTDQVPHDVAIQCHWSMDITGIKQWDVAALVGGNQFFLYHLYFDADVAKALRDIGRTFWDYVEQGIEPPVDGLAATTAYLAQKFPLHGETLREATVEEADWLHKLLATRAAIKLLEKDEDELGNKLRNAIGDSAGIECVVGKATWKRPNGSTVAWKAVVEALSPDPEVLAPIVAEHSSPMARRFLPLPPPKSKKAR